MSEDPVVVIDGVTKRYGDQLAVADMTLAIDRGQFVTLLGPSGCGKSTTLRMLGGFETPTTGRIFLGGRDVTRVPPHRRNVNIVFQDYALFPHLSVARNVAFGLELKGLTRKAITGRVDELLDLVRLQDFADRLPGQLSGGQRQRVALVRALAPDPQLLLLDEPLSALDAKLRGQMQVELKSIQRETGKTFVFVTHDQEEALTMSDLVVVMNKGRIEQMGAPEALYAAPRTRFVAGFIGTTNLLDGTVIGREGDRVRLDWGGAVVEAMAHGVATQPGAAVTISVRPEHLRLSTADGSGPLTGRVTSRLFKGSQTVATVQLPANREVEALLDPASVSGLGGDAVSIGWDAARAVVIAD